VANLGSGHGSQWPTRIDTRQIYRNSPLAKPDSDVRLDAEFANDTLDYAIKTQITLGANPQGQYGSVAARLNQFVPGGGAAVTNQAFGSSTHWVLPGSQHHLGSPAILLYAYDNTDPAIALDPGALQVDPSSYDITADFGVDQAGLLVATLGEPSYSALFAVSAAPYTVTILGTTHQLATANLCVQLRDSTGAVISPATVRVHPVTYDVTLVFSQAQDGRVILGVPGGVSSTPFTDETEVVVLGATHGLGTRALCWQLWDDASPETNSLEPGSLTVDPDTFDVTLTFGQPTSGRLVLGRALGSTGADFQVKDAGIADQTAVRLYSDSGTLNLQQGSGDATVFRNKTGSAVATVNATGQMGLGTTPTHQLHLSTDDAAKLATATWATTSDARLKDVLRPYTDGLELLLALDPVWYRYNGLGGIRRDGQEYVGLLAQAVQHVAPYMVQSHRGRLTPEQEETDLLEFNAAPLIFALVNAVKALASQVSELHTLIAQLHSSQPPEDAS
jgi:hypothetical protein